MNQHLSAARLFYSNVGKLQLKQMDLPHSPNTWARSKAMPGSRCTQGWAELARWVSRERVCS